jgi:hypothetical protein
MRPRPFARLALVGVLLTASCGDKTTVPSGLIDTLTGLVEIVVVPSTAAVEVGEKVTLVANVSAPAGADRGVTWRSDNLAVATVTPEGVVTCAGAGSATITATTRTTTVRSSSALVTCTLSPAISITPTDLAFDHTIGTTSCPQAIGSLRITAGSRAVEVTITSGDTSLTTTPARLTLAPADSATVLVAFNCMKQGPFTTQLTLVSRTTSGTETQTVTVSANIHR